MTGLKRESCRKHDECYSAVTQDEPESTSHFTNVGDLYSGNYVQRQRTGSRPGRGGTTYCNFNLSALTTAQRLQALSDRLSEFFR